MTHRFPLPDDVRLEKLIEEVFMEQHSAEQEKLNRVEANLLRKIKRNNPVKKLNKMPWWFVLLLAGSFATAAWWTAEQLHEKNGANNLIIESKSIAPIEQEKIIMNGQGENKTEQEHHEINERDNSPVIYQRENL